MSLKNLVDEMPEQAVSVPYPDFRPQLSRLYQAVDAYTNECERANGQIDAAYDEMLSASSAALNALAMDAHDAAVRYAKNASVVTVCPVCNEVPMPSGNACGRCGDYNPGLSK